MLLSMVAWTLVGLVGIGAREAERGMVVVMDGGGVVAAVAGGGKIEKR